jgi:hypothetical protein
MPRGWALVVSASALRRTPGNTPPKFGLSGTAGNDFLAGVTNWNGQANNTGVSFQSGSSIGSPNAIVSPTWPRAIVTYYDTSANQHTVNIDFSSLPGNIVAATLSLDDFDLNGNKLTTSAGFVTLINTNGSYVSVVNGQTYPLWSPTGANFDGALIQIGEHETGHQFLLGDQSGGGDIMSPWQPTVSNPGGGTNNQTGNASSTISTCDNIEIQDNSNGPYQLPPPPPNPNPRPCLVDGNPCDPCDPDCTPIILDTDGEGFHLTSAEAGVMFDISGSGQTIRIAWTNPDFHNAFLTLPGPDGLVHNGKELFGNFTPQPPSDHPNGFIALAQYDKPENGGNGDGIIDQRDEVYSRLRLWIDENHDGICQPNELHRLPELGVYSLSFNYVESRRTDEFGNRFRYKARVNSGERQDFRDDRQHGVDEVGRWSYDVFLAIH